MIRDRRGVALLLVMGMVILIASMAMSFHDQMALRLAEAKMGALDAQATALARSGVTLGKLLLKLDVRPYQWFHQDEAGGASDDSDGENKTPVEPLDKIYQLLAATRRDGLPLEGGQLSIDLIDENARVNINKASEQHLAALFQIAGLKRIKKLEIYGENAEEDISREAAASVLNWRGWRRPGAADDTYYQTLKPPYVMRSAPFEVTEELMLVKDITPLAFYGNMDESAGASSVTSSVEGADKPADDKKPVDDKPKKKVQGIGPLLTVWGDGRVNANNATRAVLSVVPGLMESPTRELAIAELIKRRPFRSDGELRAALALAGPQQGAAAGAGLKVGSDVVRVRATGILGRRRRTVDVVLVRKNRQVRVVYYRED